MSVSPFSTYRPRSNASSLGSPASHTDSPPGPDLQQQQQLDTNRLGAGQQTTTGFFNNIIGYYQLSAAAAADGGSSDGRKDRSAFQGVRPAPKAANVRRPSVGPSGRVLCCSTLEYYRMYGRALLAAAIRNHTGPTPAAVAAAVDRAAAATADAALLIADFRMKHTV